MFKLSLNIPCYSYYHHLRTTVGTFLLLGKFPSLLLNHYNPYLFHPSGYMNSTHRNLLPTLI